MKHTEVALRRPVTTVMVCLAAGLIGIISTKLLPLERFPDIEFPGIFIQVPYQASTPEEVERLITRPIEEAIATMSGVERMSSTSRADQAEIRVFFGWDKEVSAMGVEARAKVDAIRHELPDDIQRIFMFTGSLGDQPIVNLRISSERDLSDAYDMLDRLLKRPIERLEGVSRVELYGVDPKEIRILLSADRVAAHGVDLNELRALLEKSNFSVSAGRLTDHGQRFSVRPMGEFRTLDEVRSIIIDGANLRLGDVAVVTMRSPDRNYGRHLDRSYAIGLDVFKESGANIVELDERVARAVEKAAQSPQMQGINVFALESQADAITTSLSDLLRAGGIGALLAFAVLYLFLRQASTTAIVVLSVPFALLVTLAVMYFMDLSLNILSMMGLMLAIGMLVDNAVVVTESIFRYRRMMPDEPFKATIAGVREVGLAVVAGTATSIIVFVPIMFGTKTDITIFLTHVAVTIVVALLASLVLAQTLVPMLAARLDPPDPSREGKLMPRVTNAYTRALAWVLHHRWKTALLVVATFASVAVPMKFIKFDAFPQEAGRRLFLPYHVEGVHSLERIEEAVFEVENWLYDHADELDLENVYSYFDTGRAESTLLLTDEKDATVSTRDVIKRVEEGLPEIIIGDPSFQFDRQGGQEGFSIQVTGESTEVLAGLAREVMRVLASVEGLVDVRVNGGNAEPEIQIVVDRARAGQLGLTPEAVAGAVSVALRGENLRDFRARDGEIQTRLAFRDSDRQSIEQLADLPLYTLDGDRVRLGAVADFEVVNGLREIERLERNTAAVIEANLDEVSMEDVKPKVEALLDAFNFPPGYGWKFGTGFERTDETQQIMLTNILLGIALIFIVMAALFESTVYPLSIITSIALSVVGVFWYFLITGTTFSFMASIGIMILIGVVVNNGIVLVDHINNLRREGMPRDEAILEAGRDRIRPILMTVATTILGLLPLSLSSTQVGGDGPGAPPYFPMARAIIGGLGFSTLASLVVVPYIYVLLDDLTRWGRKVRATARRALPAQGS